MKIPNVKVKHSDGFQGWSENAPFDAILVAAAPIRVPKGLMDQLAKGGRLVIPIGVGRSQELRLITKSSNGLDEKIIEKVSFVPLLDGTE